LLEDVAISFKLALLLNTTHLLSDNPELEPTLHTHLSGLENVQVQLIMYPLTYLPSSTDLKFTNLQQKQPTPNTMPDSQSNPAIATKDSKDKDQTTQGSVSSDTELLTNALKQLEKAKFGPFGDKPMPDLPEPSNGRDEARRG
jgi:hypothetical protein